MIIHHPALDSFRGPSPHLQNVLALCPVQILPNLQGPMGWAMYEYKDGKLGYCCMPEGALQLQLCISGYHDRPRIAQGTQFNSINWVDGRSTTSITRLHEIVGMGAWHVAACGSTTAQQAVDHPASSSAAALAPESPPPVRQTRHLHRCKGKIGSCYHFHALSIPPPLNPSTVCLHPTCF